MFLPGPMDISRLPQKDSVPSRFISKVGITVRDLADGNTMDSVLVTVGVKKGYTDANGFVQFDSVVKESIVTVSKNGYLVSSKKVKPELTIRLAKKESSVYCSIRQWTI